MQYTKDYSNGDQVRVFTESAVDLIAPFAHKTVATVAELEDAIANQIAGEVIFVQPGVYLLTKVLTPRYLANGGSLVGLGLVQIGGLAAAVAAINIIAYAGGTFQWKRRHTSPAIVAHWFDAVEEIPIIAPNYVHL